MAQSEERLGCRFCQLDTASEEGSLRLRRYTLSSLYASRFCLQKPPSTSWTGWAGQTRRWRETWKRSARLSMLRLACLFTPLFLTHTLCLCVCLSRGEQGHGEKHGKSERRCVSLRLLCVFHPFVLMTLLLECVKPLFIYCFAAFSPSLSLSLTHSLSLSPTACVISLGSIVDRGGRRRSISLYSFRFSGSRLHCLSCTARACGPSHVDTCVQGGGRMPSPTASLIQEVGHTHIHAYAHTHVP